jgi:hypothetical protein
MECVPADNVLSVKVAWPPDRLALPSDVLPSRKVTLPAGVPAPGATAATMAVKVTAWPETVGLAEEVSVVAVVAGLMTWLSAVVVLDAKLVLPW